MTSFATANPRENMLKSQLLTGHVLDNDLLSAFLAVPRESFLPAPLKGVAYVDEELPLGNGRYLMEPLAFARILKHAAVTAQQTVLLVGSATGYSAALLSRLARKVVALEEDETLYAAAAEQLKGLPNVTALRGKLVGGAAQHGPYDLILIEGSVEFVSQPLADQLCEGGRMLAIEHEASSAMGTGGLGMLAEYQKIRNTLHRKALGSANARLLPAFRRPAAFAF